MKKLTFWKSLFLLCALIVGSSSAWGADTYIVSSTAASSVSDGDIVAWGTSSSTLAKSVESDWVKLSSTSSEWIFFRVHTVSGGFQLEETSSGNYIYSSAAKKVALSSTEKTTLTLNSNNIVNGGSSIGNYTFNSTGIRPYASNNYTAAYLYKVTVKSYTITAESNNTTYGTVSLNGSVITGSPNAGYRYADPAYTVSPANSATVAQDGNNFTVTPSANTTVTINFEAIPTHSATFSVNGNTTSNTLYESQAIVFPADPDAIGGKSFVGWTTAAISGTTNTAPTFVTSATMGNSDITYYAVFADVTGSSAASWTETDISNISSSDVIVISNGSYAMNNDNGTTDPPAANIISVSGTSLSVAPANNLKWNVSGNATDGYTFYPNGSTTTWLYCNTNSGSGNNNNIRVGTGDRKVWEFDDDGYLVTKDTYTARYLSIYNSQDFRSYVNTSNGAFVPKFYKYTAGSTTYANYCTNVTVPVSITTAGYASYVTPSHINFEGTGVTAYKVSAASSTITMVSITAAPEGTPVVLKAAEGDYNLKAVADKPADVDGNILLAGPVTGDGASYYVLGKDVSNKLGFGLLKTGVELPATKAYFLATSVSGARGAFIPFDSETTGIANVDVNDNLDPNAPMYNLAGQRVSKSYKGVVIVNGKKMLNK